MENTIELNEINEVDLGDNTFTVDPTPRSGVAVSTECTLDELVVVESESGDGDGDGAGSVSGFVSEARAGLGLGLWLGLGLGVKVGLPPSKRRKGRRLQKSRMTFHQLQ
jgi:hypothetical protein